MQTHAGGLEDFRSWPEAKSEAVNTMCRSVLETARLPVFIMREETKTRRALSGPESFRTAKCGFAARLSSFTTVNSR